MLRTHHFVCIFVLFCAFRHFCVATTCIPEVRSHTQLPAHTFARSFCAHTASPVRRDSPPSGSSIGVPKISFTNFRFADLSCRSPSPHTHAAHNDQLYMQTHVCMCLRVHTCRCHWSPPAHRNVHAYTPLVSTSLHSSATLLPAPAHLQTHTCMHEVCFHAFDRSGEAPWPAAVRHFRWGQPALRILYRCS